jgi:hypothetical protein
MRHIQTQTTARSPCASAETLSGLAAKGEGCLKAKGDSIQDEQNIYRDRYISSLSTRLGGKEGNHRDGKQKQKNALALLKRDNAATNGPNVLRGASAGKPKFAGDRGATTEGSGATPIGRQRLVWNGDGMSVSKERFTTQDILASDPEGHQPRQA